MELQQKKTLERTKINNIIRIAIPAVFESIIAVVITTVDTQMISVLGNGAISAVNFTTQPKLLVFAIFFALGTALSFFVSKAYGSKDKDEANRYFVFILRITVILSIIFGIVMYFLAEPIMMLCNKQENTLDMSVSFFRIVMTFMIFNNVSVVLNNALRGIGKMKVTLISSIAMGIVDIIFNYLLIEGHFGFPALGVAGDAYATVFGSVAACIVSIIFIIKERDFISLKGFFNFSIGQDKEFIRSVYSKTGNIVFENIFTRIGFLLSSIISSNLNSSSTDVYSVGMILFNYSFAFGDGISKAALTLVGNSLGAGKKHDIRVYAKYLNVIAIIVSIVLGVLFVLGSGVYFNLFFDKAELVRDGFYTSVIVAVLSLLQIVRLVEVGVLRGLGEMKAPRIMATICVLIINPATGYLFALILGYGVWGIWISSVITQLAWLILGLVFYRKHLIRQYNY